MFCFRSAIFSSDRRSARHALTNLIRRFFGSGVSVSGPPGFANPKVLGIKCQRSGALTLTPLREVRPVFGNGRSGVNRKGTPGEGGVSVLWPASSSYRGPAATAAL